jgi:FkbM family methyltransferase
MNLGRLKQQVVRLPGVDRLYARWKARQPRLLTLDGVSVSVADLSGSSMFPALVEDVAREYALHELQIGPGDVVIDIGAHVGCVSVYLAKRHPYARVYAFEPVPSNFASLRRNIAANGVANVRAFNLAVTADGRDVRIDTNLDENSGGGGFLRDNPAGSVFTVGSTTLDAIFEENGIERCRLLKIDCEGAEHEILRSTRNLERVHELVGEFHEDDWYRAQGHTVEDLERYCAQFIPRERISVVRFIG